MTAPAGYEVCWASSGTLEFVVEDDRLAANPINRVDPWGLAATAAPMVSARYVINPNTVSWFNDKEGGGFNFDISQVFSAPGLYAQVVSIIDTTDKVTERHVAIDLWDVKSPNLVVGDNQFLQGAKGKCYEKFTEYRTAKLYELKSVSGLPPGALLHRPQVAIGLKSLTGSTNANATDPPDDEKGTIWAGIGVTVGDPLASYTFAFSMEQHGGTIFRQTLELLNVQVYQRGKPDTFTEHLRLDDTDGMFSDMFPSVFSSPVTMSWPPAPAAPTGGGGLP
jgi:hypothetical protein